MNFPIFCKQVLRSFKKSLGTVVLLCFFIVIGVSLSAGALSYLINTNKLVIQRAFKNGAQDAKMNQNVFRWSEDDNVEAPAKFLFTTGDEENENIKEYFAKIVGLPDIPELEIDPEYRDSFYNYLLENSGYVQAFWENNGQNVWVTPENEVAYENFREKFKYFNGSALAYFFAHLVPEKVNEHWDIRSTNTFHHNGNNKNRITTFLNNSETNVSLTTYLSEWILENDSPPESFFQRADFEYSLLISLDEYIDLLTAGKKPLFVAPKNLKNFHLKIGQPLQLSSNAWPPNDKNPNFTIAGTFSDAGSLINFSEELSVSIPYDWFWDNLQREPNYYSDHGFFISTNIKNGVDFNQRQDYVQKCLDQTNFFIADKKAKSSLSLIDFDSQYIYNNYLIFWRTNIILTLLTIVSTITLICIVIVFITGQLVANNQQTLRFLQFLGMNNLELSLLNITNILLPMIIAFVVAVPFIFVVQNLISFLLVNQYPMVLNYWMASWQLLVAYLSICLFTLLAFFAINVLVLKKHSFGTKTYQLKFLKFIKKSKKCSRIHLKPGHRIMLAMNTANIRKSIVTLATLFISNLVILFGVGLKGSIDYQGRNVVHFYRPYKNFSGINAPLFTTTTDPSLQSTRTQEPVFKLVPEKEIDSLEELIGVFVFNKDVKGRYISSTFLDQFNSILEEVKNKLKENEEDANKISEIIQKIIAFHDDYLYLRHQLKNFYNYEGECKFIFGQTLIPTNPLETPETNRVVVTKTFLPKEVNNYVSPKNVEAFGLVDLETINKIGLPKSGSYDHVDIKISQYLATKLKISTSKFPFLNPSFPPTFTVQIPLTSDLQKTIPVKVRITGIVKTDFFANRLYYNYENFYHYLNNNKQSLTNVLNPFLKSEIASLIKLSARDDDRAGAALTNAVFSQNQIPNALLNFVLPVINNDGQHWTDYVDKNTDFSALNLNDFQLIKKNLTVQTNSYIKLVANLVYIFTSISVVVSVLLLYIFLVQNRQSILLFKSLGYKVTEIAKFMVWGYVLAALIASLFAALGAILVISRLKNAFLEMLNFSLSFEITPFFALLVVGLPFGFIFLVALSLSYYVYKQDPKRLLTFA